MIVRFITLVYLVPMSRLELLRLSPPPPQDGVSTNFTTSAIETCLRHRPQPLIRDLPSLRAGAARGRGALGTTRRNHRPRLRFLGFHDAHRLILLAGKIGQPHAGEEKYRRQNGRGPAQEIGRAARTEQAAGRAAAKGGAHVGALAVLHQHQADHGHRNDAMNNPNNRFHTSSVCANHCAALQIATNSAALSEAPPIRPPSISGMENNSAAFDAFTLPPYWITSLSATAGSRAAILPRIKAWTACACSGVAVLPVPIAHTGS